VTPHLAACACRRTANEPPHAQRVDWTGLRLSS
jgi:hypothetical protein